MEPTTTPERFLFEVINPSDPASFYATSNEVAVFAMLQLDGGRGAYAAQRVDGSFTGPLLMFGGVLALRDLGMWPVEDWITKERWAATAEALESVMLGRPEKREEDDRMLASIEDPRARTARAEELHDERRSSMNNFATYAKKLAQAIREQKL